MVVSEGQVELKLPGATYKDFDKMDDVMGHAWVEDSEEVSEYIKEISSWLCLQLSAMIVYIIGRVGE